MKSTTRRHGMLQDAVASVLLLTILWLLPCLTAAGDFSDVPAIKSQGFSLPDLAGQTHVLDEFAGKVVLVNFWASWCIPCIEEMPSIQRLASTLRDQPFAVIGINVGEGQRRVQATVNRLSIDFPVRLDADSTVFKAWGAEILPTTFVLDRNGRVRYIGRGAVDWNNTDIVDSLKRLIAEAPASD